MTNKQNTWQRGITNATTFGTTHQSIKDAKDGSVNIDLGTCGNKPGAASDLSVDFGIGS